MIALSSEGINNPYSLKKNKGYILMIIFLLDALVLCQLNHTQLHVEQT